MANIVIIFKMALHLLHVLLMHLMNYSRTLKFFFHTKSHAILSLLTQRLLETPRNALNTIFVRKSGFAHHVATSNGNRSSFLHSKNLSSVPPLLVYPGEVVHLTLF